MSAKVSHIGSNFDTFLAEEGILEDVNAIAVIKVIALKISQFIDDHHLVRKRWQK